LLGAAALACACAGSRPPDAEAKRPSRIAVAVENVDASADAVASTDRAEEVHLAHPPLRPPPPPPPAPDQAGNCPKEADARIGLLVSPLHPAVGSPVRVLAADLDNPAPLAVRIEGRDSSVVDATTTHRSGVPAATVAQIVPEEPGDYRVLVGRGGQGLRCATIRVAARRFVSAPRAALADAVWPVSRRWNGAEEALFSAWVREMFHAPRGEDLAFTRLGEVTSNPTRNLLFDYFGWNEDSSTSAGLRLKPDCADTPYFMRAYFAWKRALPFAFRQCSSGEDQKPPRCDPSRSILDVPDRPANAPAKWNELSQVRHYFSRALTAVHSGNGRTPFGDNESDFYGVELTRKGLRPGSIYADPYGHILVLVEFVEPELDLPGVLYAFDGQPDGSITRKRFWEGNFIWNPDPTLGGTGFKAFRPLVVRQAKGGRVIESLGDERITSRPDYGDASSMQAGLSADAFYDRIERLITPGVRDPFVDQEEIVRALSEAAKVRVTSVGNGHAFLVEHPDTVIPMPEGKDIFETSGPWEDFSTPSRDLRLLFAIDVVDRFEAKVARNPDAYGAAPGKALDDLLVRLGTERKRLLDGDSLAFTYRRSNGTPFTLTLEQLRARAKSLETAYDPNDCPEVRWGAPLGSEELATCDRRAPEDQRQKMEGYRPWFRDRRRPPR
jgi:hypothetical protein